MSASLREAIHDYVKGAIGGLRRFRPYASPEDQAKIDKHIAGFEEARISLRELRTNLRGRVMSEIREKSRWSSYQSSPSH